MWPEILKYKNIAEQQGKYFMVHIDGDYTGHADLFADLIPGKTVLQLDGFSDSLAMAPQLTKNKIAVWGDVHPSMLCTGSYDDVYKHCMALKEAYGPGIILSAGCSYPPQSKLENIRAMQAAAQNMDF